MHCPPAIPQQKLVTEAVGNLADDVAVNEPVTVDPDALLGSETSHVERPSPVPEPDLGGSEKGARRTESKITWIWKKWERRVELRVEASPASVQPRFYDHMVVMPGGRKIRREADPATGGHSVLTQGGYREQGVIPTAALHPASQVSLDAEWLVVAALVGIKNGFHPSQGNVLTGSFWQDVAMGPIVRNEVAGQGRDALDGRLDVLEQWRPCPRVGVGGL